VLGVAGVALIILGTMEPGGNGSPSIPPIARPTGSPTPEPTASASGPSASSAASLAPSASVAPTPTPTRTPLPSDVVAEQLEIPSVGINVLVRQSTTAETDAFPPVDAAYVLRNSSQPGRNQSSYIFAHALNTLFKPLWNVQIGAEVLVRMSDGTVLSYVVTEVRPNIPCPDPNADPALNPPNPPPALQIHEDCSEGSWWLATQPYERLTLQTSQGYNRNWGELIVVAELPG
jgi:hypothetical protein